MLFWARNTVKAQKTQISQNQNCYKTINNFCKMINVFYKINEKRLNFKMLTRLSSHAMPFSFSALFTIGHTSCKYFSVK